MPIPGNKLLFITVLAKVFLALRLDLLDDVPPCTCIYLYVLINTPYTRKRHVSKLRIQNYMNCTLQYDELPSLQHTREILLLEIDTRLGGTLAEIANIVLHNLHDS